MESSDLLKNIFLGTILTALILGALIGISIFIFGEFGDVEIRILITTLSLGGFSLTGLCCSTIYDYPSFHTLSLSGIAVSVLSFIVSLAGIWELSTSEWTFGVVFSLVILSVTFAHISLMMPAEAGTNYKPIILYTTLGCIIIVAGMLMWAALNDFENSTSYFSILGVFAFFDLLGTFLMPLVGKKK
jgi:hypothetical protein